MKSMKLPILTLVILAGVGFYVWKYGNPFAPPAVTAPSEKTAEAPGATPAIQHPVTAPAEKNDEPIPKLDESDKNIALKAPELFGKMDYADVLVLEDFIRHFVVSMENATGKQIPVAMAPVKPAPEELIVTGTGPDYTLSDKNFARYHQYAAVAEHADLQKIASYYRRMYPLFQAAYQDLGTQGYFNDKVFQVMDQVEATPQTLGPIHLKHTTVRYEYADANLESLSAIQKILIRMGPKNEALFKAKCKELRKLLGE